jgi:hypothetical protein
MIAGGDRDRWLLDSSAELPCLHPLDRSIRLLRIAGLDSGTEGEAADWPLAARDFALLELARELFGDKLDCIATCPGCGDVQEFDLSATALATELAAPKIEKVRSGGWDIEIVPLTSRRVATAVTGRDAAEAAKFLRAAAVGRISDGTRSIEFRELPEDVTEEIVERIEEREAGGEALIELSCDRCGYRWTEPFNPGAYLMDRIDEAASRLLFEVSTLARAFGWNEGETLALPPVRRRAYVEIAAA